MALQIPDVFGSVGERQEDPCGFLPVFQTEAQARAHAGDRYAVHAIRLQAPLESASGDRTAAPGPEAEQCTPKRRKRAGF
jgi:hypothetical protein